MDTTDHTAFSPGQIAAHHWGDSLWFRLLLFLALGLGIFFRLGGLGHKIYSHDETYTSLDSAGYVGGEVFSGVWDGTDKTAEDIQRFLRPAEGRGILRTLSIVARFEPHEAPIYFLLSHVWMRTVGHTPAAMRGLAALLSLLCIPAVYWLAKELFGSSRTALLAAALLAISPYQILFAQDARPYSLWMLMTLLSSAALLRALRKNTFRTWLVYSLTLAVGMYSHQLFALVAIVHALYLTGKHLLQAPRAYAGFIAAAVAAFLAYTPWIYAVFMGWYHVSRRMDWANIRIPWYRYIQRWMLNFSSPFLDLDFRSGNLIPYLLRAVLLLLVAWALIFLIRHASFQQKKFLVLLYILPAGVFIASDVLLGGIRSIGGRYFVPASVAAILVMAFFLSTSLDRASPAAMGRWAGLTGLLVAAALLSNVNILQAETWWNKELGRIHPEFVHQIDRDGTLLIVSGYYPTILGDMLSLSLKVDADVQFRLHDDPNFEIEYSSDHRRTYWYPGADVDLQEISERDKLRVREVLPGMLWQIEGTDE